MKKSTGHYEIKKIRTEFPILEQKINGYPLAYLDNAATTQKPLKVINTLQDFYVHSNANVHRGVHTLAERATQLFENARLKSRDFIHAKNSHECLFVHGTTEGINLVAYGFSRLILKPGDEIILSQIEHHSNIVPWQMACEYTGAKLRIISCNDCGELDLDEYANLLNEKTKIVSVTHVSNVLGTINPIQKMCEMAHANNTPILVDGAQAAPHLKIDVQKLGCDFYVFSGHKMYGPTGIGLLYGKSDWLERLPPYQGGGEMIKSVSFSKTLYNVLPYKFEAGTPPIAQAIGLGSAIDFLTEIGLDNIRHYEHELLEYALTAMRTVPGLRLIGTASHKASVISFLLDKIHAHDVGTILNDKGIAVRTGKLCAEPAMQRFGVSAVVRASFGLYNTQHEIDRLVTALHDTNQLFRKS